MTTEQVKQQEQSLHTIIQMDESPERHTEDGHPFNLLFFFLIKKDLFSVEASYSDMVELQHHYLAQFKLIFALYFCETT